MPETRSVTRRATVALLVGLIGIVPLLDRPRLQSMHAVDLLTLIACGMCFGVALTLFIFAFRTRRA